MVKSSSAESQVAYALMVVDSMNIGDAIQAIAARQFLPRVDYYIERDDLSMLQNIHLGPGVALKMIMNGWYIDDGALFPPPMLEGFEPLLISMHANSHYANNYTEKVFLTEESRAFFKTFGPVGARDTHTEAFFRRNGINSYFSGCLTLTLTPEELLTRRDHILAVNVSDAVYKSLQQRTDRPIIRMDVDATQNLTNREMLAMGEYYLTLYQTAHLVVTTRLHATLPTVALGGRVLFIEETNLVNKDFAQRFAGLHTLVHHMTVDEFVNDDGSRYDLERPVGGGVDREYLELRRALIRRCEEYIGVPMRKGFLYGKTLDNLVSSDDFIGAVTRMADESAEFYKAAHGWNVLGISTGSMVRSLAKRILNRKTW